MEEQTIQQIPNRRQRRAMLKATRRILRHLSKLPFLGETRTNFRAKNLETGKQIHNNLTERIEKENADRLEAILTWFKNRLGTKRF